MRLKTKLVLVFIILTLLVTSIMSILSYNFVKQHVLEEHSKLTTQILETEAQKFDAWLQQKVGVLASVSHDLTTPGLSKQQKQFILEYHNHKQDSDIHDLYVGLENGEVIADPVTMENIEQVSNYDPRFRPWYQQGIFAGGVAFSQPYKNILSDQYDIFTITMPIYFPEENLNGLVAMDIKLEALENYIKNLHAIRKYKKSQAVLVDKNGLILMHPDAKYIYNVIHFLPEFSGIAEKLFVENTKMFKTTYKNQEVIVNKVNIPSTEWKLGVIVPYKEVLAPIAYLKRIFIIVSIICIIIALLCSLIISKQISRPIELLSRKTVLLANGDLNVKVPVKGNDEISGLSQHFNDTVQQIKLLIYKTQEASRLKSEFISNMSHELRTPLNSIIGFTQLILTQCKDTLLPKHIKHLQTVERNGHHLLNLVNQILDLSAIEAGKNDLVLEKFNCVELINEVVELALPLAQKKQLKLINTSKEKEVYISSDRQKLLQILINLTGNAIKFTDKGEVKLKVETVLSENGTHKINIFVSDTGIGIQQEDIKTIFEPFRQVDGSVVRKKGGTGIGLYLSQKLCHLLKGQINVKSNVDEGTTFCCSFNQDISQGRFH